jgi:nucleoside-triphosphatase THEP1
MNKTSEQFSQMIEQFTQKSSQELSQEQTQLEEVTKQLNEVLKAPITRDYIPQLIMKLDELGYQELKHPETRNLVSSVLEANKEQLVKVYDAEPENQDGQAKAEIQFLKQHTSSQEGGLFSQLSQTKFKNKYQLYFDRVMFKNDPREKYTRSSTREEAQNENTQAA